MNPTNKPKAIEAILNALLAVPANAREHEYEVISGTEINKFKPPPPPPAPVVKPPTPPPSVPEPPMEPPVLK